MLHLVTKRFFKEVAWEVAASSSTTWASRFSWVTNHPFGCSWREAARTMVGLCTSVRAFECSFDVLAQANRITR